MSVPAFVINGECVGNALIHGGAEKIFLEKLLRSAQVGKCNLVAPTLLDLEVANIVVQHFSNPETVMRVMQAFRDFPIERVEVEAADIPHVAQIAIATKGTAYEAAYHAVAIQLKATYLSVNASYVKAAKSFGSVALLADLLE